MHNKNKNMVETTNVDAQEAQPRVRTCCRDGWTITALRRQEDAWPALKVPHGSPRDSWAVGGDVLRPFQQIVRVSDARQSNRRQPLRSDFWRKTGAHRIYWNPLWRSPLSASVAL